MQKLISRVIFFTLLVLSIISKTAYATESNDMVHIAMATNESYLYQTLVSMTSAAENKDEKTNLNFHILISGEFSNKGKKKLIDLQERYRKCKVELIDMGNSFNNAKTMRKSFTAAYYRLQLPDILQGLDKVLYLDGDTIVMKDLLSLYNLNLDNYYAAGVKDYWSVTKDPDYYKIIGIESMDQYINSGVLLMNLDKMRNDNLKKEFSAYIKKNHCSKKRIGKYHDQDVINYTCYGKILHIPLKYNAMHSCIYDYYCTTTHKLDISLFNNIKKFYGESEWNEAVTSPTIIHYVGSNRPWGTPIKLPGSLIWWKYAKKTDSFKEMVKKFRTKWNYRYMDEMIKTKLQ